MDEVDEFLNKMSGIELVQLFVISRLTDKIPHNAADVYQAFFHIVRLQFLDIAHLAKHFNDPVSARVPNFLQFFKKLFFEENIT